MSRVTRSSNKNNSRDSEDPMSSLDTSELSAESKRIVCCLIRYLDDKLGHLMTSKFQQLDSMQSTINSLQSRIEKMEDEFDSASAYERRDLLVISGEVPNHTIGENCREIVRDLLKNETNLNVDAGDISIAHRIGAKLKKQGPDQRSIMFKLVRRDLKSDILHACRTNKPKFFVNESLTPIRNRILYALRRAKKKFPSHIHHCRSFDGNVTVFMHSTERSSYSPNDTNQSSKLRKLIVNTRKRLEDFLNNELSSSLEGISVEWND